MSTTQNEQNCQNEERTGRIELKHTETLVSSLGEKVDRRGHLESFNAEFDSNCVGIGSETAESVFE